MLVITNCKHDFLKLPSKNPNVLLPLNSLLAGNLPRKHVLLGEALTGAESPKADCVTEVCIENYAALQVQGH